MKKALRRLLSTAVAVTASLAIAPAANASTASLVGGKLTITANPGEANDIFARESYDDTYVEDAAGITPGPGCVMAEDYDPPYTVVCEGSTTAGMQIDAGDGSDQVDVMAGFYFEGVVTVNGGSGDDRISVTSARSVIEGGEGNDEIAGHNDRDTLYGGAGNDTIAGRGGDDTIDGGPGTDSIFGDSDRLTGGDGNDTIRVRDGERDQVSCGAGADIVTADPADVIEPLMCERVDVGAGGGAKGACAKAKAKLKQAKKALKRAKAAGDRAKIAKARAKVKRAKKKVRKAC